MTQQQHPITPPPDLVQKWVDEYIETNPDCAAPELIATRAAQYGADQELEACCALMDDWGLDGEDLMQCRRPKLPSLKERALEIVRRTPINSAGLYSYEHIEIIRRALESIPDQISDSDFNG